MRMLAPTKADHLTKERSCNWGMVGARGAGRMYQSDLHTSCWPAVREDWLEPRGKNLCRICHRPKVFLSVSNGSYDGDWTSCIAWCEPPYSKEFLRASGLLYPAERGGGESRVPSLRSF